MRLAHRSLRRDLLFPLLSLWAMAALVATLAAYWFVGRATDQSFDRFLQDDAFALANKVQWRGSTASFAGDEATAESVVFDSLARARYLVQTASGRTLVGNARLLLPVSMEPLAPGAPAFFDLEHPAGALRAVAVSVGQSPGQEPVRIFVAESKTGRQQASIEIARAIFVPAALVGFVILPLIYLGIRRGLAPTEAISQIVAQRGIHDLSPLPLNDVPDELRGLVQHTNALLNRLDDAVSEQRRFLSDAAHQLQTPVAGIRLLVGDLRRTQRADARQPADAEVLRQLDDAAGRAAHLVRELLALARIDQDAVTEELAIDPAALVSHAVGHWRVPISNVGKTVHLDVAPEVAGVSVRGSPTLLEEVIGNLLDNALRYGGTRITVDVRRHDAWLCISVMDDGPALEASTLEHMFRPFWRGAHGVAGGSGLGLSIAQRVLQRMNGSLAARFASAAGGTVLEIRLPVKDALIYDRLRAC